MHYSNLSAHNQGQSHWFQCCSTVQRAPVVASWPPEWLSQGKGKRKFYHPHFTGGRMKHMEGKEGQEIRERCKRYVQGHPGRLLQHEKMNPHFSLHLFFLLSTYKVSTLRAARESLYVSMLLRMVVTKRSPHLHRCRMVEIYSQLLNQSSRERNSV